jgi:hypothetical protein
VTEEELSLGAVNYVNIIVIAWVHKFSNEEPPENCKHKKSDMKQVAYQESTNIRQHNT